MFSVQVPQGRDNGVHIIIRVVHGHVYSTSLFKTVHPNFGQDDRKRSTHEGDECLPVKRWWISIKETNSRHFKGFSHRHICVQTLHFQRDNYFSKVQLLDVQEILGILRWRLRNLIKPSSSFFRTDLKAATW